MSFEIRVERLVGLDLDDPWSVGERLDDTHASTVGEIDGVALTQAAARPNEREPAALVKTEVPGRRTQQ